MFLSGQDMLKTIAIQKAHGGGGGGGDPVLDQISITENGLYTPDSGVDGYNEVSVNVPNHYGFVDEGKVVQNGELVAQTGLDIAQNGTYNTTTNDEVIVNVPTGYPEPTGTIAITTNGTHNVKDYAEASVNVPGGILTGTTPPTSDIGSDGDYYKQTFPLASGVSFVEYLESSGTQYIDTGLYGNQDTSYAIDYENVRPGWRFGSRASAQSRSLMVTPAGSSASSEYIDYGTSRYTASNLSARRKICIRDGLLYVDDQPKARYSLQSFVTPSTLLLFAVHENTTVNIAGAARFYRAVIWQDSVPVADYLPCLDGNGVACMWDNVAQEYVYNDGTGDFAYGSAATPDPLDPVLYVKESGAWRLIGEDEGGYPEPTGAISITENGTVNVKDYAEANVNVSGGGGTDPITQYNNYIQSSGTQYINTEYIAQNGDKFEIIAEIPKDQDTYACLFGRRPSASSKQVYILTKLNAYVICGQYASGGSHKFMAETVYASGGANTVNDSRTIADTYNKKIRIVLDGNHFEIYDVNGLLWYSPIATPGDVEANLPMYLFAMNTNGSIDLTCRCKIYLYRVYDINNNLKLEMIATQNNGVACMQDTVSGDYFYNAGSGDFVYGTDT